jgi:hypothetical protein
MLLNNKLLTEVIGSFLRPTIYFRITRNPTPRYIHSLYLVSWESIVAMKKSLASDCAGLAIKRLVVAKQGCFSCEITCH